MDLKKYLLLLVVLCLKDGETGGHGEKHHDHVRVHLPEFIHHDHHTKVITIHHHHHKPKKEHHHHHHHHPKPHIPMSHHYHHQHKKSTSHTSSKGHEHHGHHGHHHGHHGHHGHHSHKSHGHGHHHHHDPVPYDPPVPSSYDENYGSYAPPTYDAGFPSHVPQVPKVHGITHTVKQVKVFDSLPGVLPSGGGLGGNHGYEVTEQGEADEDDVFTSVNGLQQSYPATFGYVRSAAEQPSHDPFAELTPQGAVHSNNHDPFAGAVAQTSVPVNGGDSFAGTVQSDPFASAAPSPPGIPVQAAEFPVSFQGDAGFDNPNAFVGDDGGNTVFLSNDGATENNELPVSFHREAGIQQSVNTGGVETVVY